MKLLVSDHVANIAESFEKGDLLELEEIVELLSNKDFSSLVDELSLEKLNDSEEVYVFSSSNFDVYVAYLEEQGILIVVDVLTGKGIELDNLDLLKERSLPREWINVAAYYIAEKERFLTDPKDNWFSAKKELILRVFNVWR